MSAALAHDAGDDRFALRLVTVAVAGELRAWLDQAAAGERAVYAVGPILPRETETVQLVTRWKNAGDVITLQRRDKADGRRIQFLIEKVAAGCQPPSAPGAEGGFPPVETPAARGNLSAHDTRAQMRQLLAALRRMAARGEACPSNAALAEMLDLRRGKRGADRAQYLLGRLTREKRIAVESRGTCAPRVVTILAAGRAQGRRTA